jgi:hypothetical protein
MNRKSWGSAPINEITENLQSLNIDKRTLKRTGRVHLFATRVKKEWITQLKSIAYEDRLKYVEVLEKALEAYKILSENNLIKPKKKPKEIKKLISKLYPHSYQDFICNTCQEKFYNKTAYSPMQDSTFLEETYCINCVKITKEEDK